MKHRLSATGTWQFPQIGLIFWGLGFWVNILGLGFLVNILGLGFLVNIFGFRVFG